MTRPTNTYKDMYFSMGVRNTKPGEAFEAGVDTALILVADWLESIDATDKVETESIQALRNGQIPPLYEGGGEEEEER